MTSLLRTEETGLPTPVYLMKNTVLVLLTLLSASWQSTEGSAGARGDLASTIEESAREMMAAQNVKGISIAVVMAQDVILAKGIGDRSRGKGDPYAATTRCEMFSATKVLSSLAILSLVEKGLFDIDAPLGSYLEQTPPEWQRIPFWRLLNHTSGITTIIDKPIFELMVEDPNASDRDVLEIVREHPLDYEPGQFSRYRQSGYAIAAQVVSEQLEMPWHEVVQKYVTKPAKMQNTVNGDLASGKRQKSLLAAAGGAVTTAEDMSRLFKALNADQVVTSETLLRELFAEERVQDQYSLGSILEVRKGERTVGHRGGGARANVRYVPAAKVGVAVFTDHPPAAGSEMIIELTEQILDRIL